MKVFATPNPADDPGKEVPVPLVYRQYIIPVSESTQSCRLYEFGYILSQEIPAGPHTIHRFFAISDRPITLYPYHEQYSVGIMYNLKGNYTCQISPDMDPIPTRSGDYGPYYAPAGPNLVRVTAGLSGALQLMLHPEEPVNGWASLIPAIQSLLDRAQQQATQGKPIALLRMNSTVRELVNRIALFDESIQSPQLYFQGILYVLASELSKQLHLHQQQQADEERPREKVKKVYDYIIERPNLRTCTMDYLSQLAGLSEANLRKLFKQIYQQPIQHFVREQCLQKAAILLRENTGMRIEDIAFEVGYANQANLSNAFKAMFGKYPREYRKLM